MKNYFIFLLIFICSFYYFINAVRSGKFQQLIDENTEHKSAEIAQLVLIKYHYYTGRNEQTIWEIDHFLEIFKDSKYKINLLDMKADLLFRKKDKKVKKLIKFLIENYPDDPRKTKWLQNYNLKL